MYPSSKPETREGVDREQQFLFLHLFSAVKCSKSRQTAGGKRQRSFGTIWWPQAPTQDRMRRRYSQVARVLYYFCSEISFDQACETKQKPLLYILAYILPEQGKWKEFILLVLEKWAVSSLLHVICAWSISEWVVPVCVWWGWIYAFTHACTCIYV